MLWSLFIIGNESVNIFYGGFRLTQAGFGIDVFNCTIRLNQWRHLKSDNQGHLLRSSINLNLWSRRSRNMRSHQNASFVNTYLGRLIWILSPHNCPCHIVQYKFNDDVQFIHHYFCRLSTVSVRSWYYLVVLYSIHMTY